MKSIPFTPLFLLFLFFLLSGTLSAQSKPDTSAPKSKSIPVEVFPRQGQAGIPVSKYAVAKSCIDASKSTFTAILKPASDVDLVSFVVYATSCGGMDLKISGPDVKESKRYNIVAGKNHISVSGLNVRLTEGLTYTLTCTGVKGSGSCKAKVVPRFENTGKCGNVSSSNHPNLILEPKGAPHIFELKFRHQ